MAWLKEEWNRPSRTDRYLMQIACEVARVLSKNKRAIRPEHFWQNLLKGQEKAAKASLAREATEEQRLKRTKKSWFSRLGIGKKDGR